MSEHAQKVLELGNLIEKGQDDTAALVAAGDVIDELLQLPPNSLSKEESAHLNACFLRLLVCTKPELKVSNLVRALLAAE